MKKILFYTLLCILLCSLLAFSGQAEEISAAPTASQSEAASEGSTAPDHPSQEEPPLTAALADFFSENADTLLGALTLGGSLLVAFFYKMGLLPMLRSGLGALKELLGKTKDVTEAFAQSTGESVLRIEEHTAPILSALEKGEGLLHTLEERFAALEEVLSQSERERRDTAAVLRTETELFYELLQSVNLPEAQKESMTESYYRLKRRLEGSE